MANGYRTSWLRAWFSAAALGAATAAAGVANAQPIPGVPAGAAKVAQAKDEAPAKKESGEKVATATGPIKLENKISD
ncbi:MAG: hypothetical protein LC745_04065, partial [Planctomycetia bacterium]|nr:hypothetical protein [Planctomycetia bacterium]